MARQFTGIPFMVTDDVDDRAWLLTGTYVPGRPPRESGHIDDWDDGDPPEVEVEWLEEPGTGTHVDVNDFLPRFESTPEGQRRLRLALDDTVIDQMEGAS